MATYTLDDIRAAAEQRYGDLTIALPDGDVVLRNALRLSREDRHRLRDLQVRISDAQDTQETATPGESTQDADQRADQAEDEMLDAIRDTLRLLTGPDAAARLLRYLGDDVPALVTVFERFQEVAQPGEASPSAS